MAQRKTISSRSAAPRDTTKAKRLPLAKTVPHGPIAHTKTMANGQPRPKSRK